VAGTWSVSHQSTHNSPVQGIPVPHAGMLLRLLSLVLKIPFNSESHLREDRFRCGVDLEVRASHLCSCSHNDMELPSNPLVGQAFLFSHFVDREAEVQMHHWSQQW
jgi:hypothetical protein